MFLLIIPSTGSSSSLAAPTSLHQQNNNNNPPPTSTSLPCTPINTPSSTPVPQLNSGGSLNNLGGDNSNGGRNMVSGGSGICGNGSGGDGGGSQPNQPTSNSLIQSHLANVEHFGSFLGEDIVNSWRRGFGELPPPNPSSNTMSPSIPPSSTTSSSALVSTLAPSMQMRLMNHHLHQQQQQQQINNHHHQLNHHHQHLHNTHMNNHHHQRLNTHSPSITDGMHNSQHDIDKTSSHHDTSSRASTPILDTTPRGISSSIEENLHLNGLNINSMPLPMTKSPAEDNNNSLGSLTHPAGLIPGLPFQFQERGHFRFADDLQMPPGSMVGRLGDSLIPKGDPMEARLQEMLRYNMDKYSNKSLDTLHISRRVRELLSVHNIGQRLFAKYVLGLSQGTVSELLSKPKPWDKLTEKGRDSYRKMHAWGCDDNAVMLLKSLIPKKGKLMIFFFFLDFILFF